MTNFKEDLSRIKAFIFDIDGVLSCQTVMLSGDGEPVRTANIRDAFAIQLAIKMGYKVGIISGANCKHLRVRLETLGVTDIYLGASNKIDAYQDFLQKNKVKSDVVLYMGDDIPDIPVMQLVQTPTCPADAAVEVKSLAKYVSLYNGGCGCARDVIEQVLKAQNNWLNSQSAFVW